MDKILYRHITQSSTNRKTLAINTENLDLDKVKQALPGQEFSIEYAETKVSPKDNYSRKFGRALVVSRLAPKQFKVDYVYHSQNLSNICLISLDTLTKIRLTFTHNRIHLDDERMYDLTRVWWE